MFSGGRERELFEWELVKQNLSQWRNTCPKSTIDSIKSMDEFEQSYVHQDSYFYHVPAYSKCLKFKLLNIDGRATPMLWFNNIYYEISITSTYFCNVSINTLNLFLSAAVNSFTNKSMGWFLYDIDLRNERVNILTLHLPLQVEFRRFGETTALL